MTYSCEWAMIACPWDHHLCSFLHIAVVVTAVDLSCLKTWTLLIVQSLRCVSQFNSVILVIQVESWCNVCVSVCPDNF